MLKYRIYMALIIGVGFAALVFLVMTCLSPNLAVGMIGIAVLMPGIGLLGVIRDQCCASPLPMLAANGLIYSGAALPLVWLGTRSHQSEGLRRFARSLTLIVAGTIALGWGAARTLEWAWSAPSDDALTRQFNQQRGNLETLVSMAQKDSLIGRVADDFIWRQDSVAWPRPELEWGITKERWNEYRTLFQRVGLSAGLNKDSQGNIYFISHTEGSVVSGASTGFVYCEKTGISGSAFLPCTEQRDSGKQESPKGKGAEYHRLAEHWYIYSGWD